MGKQKQPVRAWAVIFWLLVWQLASMALRAAYPHGALLLASPADAAKRLAELSVTADFWRAVARSAAHILGGFLLSCALAVVARGARGAAAPRGGAVGAARRGHQGRAGGVVHHPRPRLARAALLRSSSRL